MCVRVESEKLTGVLTLEEVHAALLVLAAMLGCYLK